MTEQFEALSGRAYLQTVGDVAHIRGEKAGAARYDATYPDPDAAASLLLMCKPHRDQIDKISPDHYSVELLENMRRDHIASLERDRHFESNAFALYKEQVEKAELTLKLDDFSAWTAALNSATSANIDRTFLHEIEQWSSETLRTQLPSNTDALIPVSRPLLEEALLGLAQSVDFLVRSMRFLASRASRKPPGGVASAMEPPRTPGR
jgi:hypothetical protein